MRGKESIISFQIALFLSVCGIALAQESNQKRIFIIKGRPGNVPVIQMNGRSYVEVEAPARVSNGALSFAGNQILLAIPVDPVTATEASAGVPTPPSIPGFVFEFSVVPNTCNWDAPRRSQINRLQPTVTFDTYIPRAPGAP